MNAFENAKYDASGLLADYERELNRLEMRWADIVVWYDKFDTERSKALEAWSDVQMEYCDRHSDWFKLLREREDALYFNSHKKWYQESKPVPDLPARPSRPARPAGCREAHLTMEGILFNQFLTLERQLQAGYQAAKLSSTLEATAEQMVEIFAIVQGTKLDNLFATFDRLNPPRPDAGND